MRVPRHCGLQRTALGNIDGQSGMLQLPLGSTVVCTRWEASVCDICLLGNLSSTASGSNPCFVAFAHCCCRRDRAMRRLLKHARPTTAVRQLLRERAGEQSLTQTDSTPTRHAHAAILSHTFPVGVTAIQKSRTNNFTLQQQRSHHCCPLAAGPWAPSPPSVPCHPPAAPSEVPGADGDSFPGTCC